MSNDVFCILFFLLTLWSLVCILCLQNISIRPATLQWLNCFGPQSPSQNFFCYFFKTTALSSVPHSCTHSPLHQHLILVHRWLSDFKACTMLLLPWREPWAHAPTWAVAAKIRQSLQQVTELPLPVHFPDPGAVLGWCILSKWNVLLGKT